MKANTPIRVLLADSREDVRGMLSTLLKRETNTQVVVEVNSAAAMLQSIQEFEIDVVVTCSTFLEEMGNKDNWLACAEGLNLKILLLAEHHNSRFVLQALYSGVTGYLMLDRAAEDIGDAIRTVAANRTYLSPGIAGIRPQPRGVGRNPSTTPHTKPTQE